MVDEEQSPYTAYAALEGRLHAVGLSRFAEQILALAQTAITLSLIRTDEHTIGVGATKVGGVADLPPDVEWPAQDGSPLPFIGQVRLEEIVRLDTADELPHTGLLSFFYAARNAEGKITWDDPSAWRALYTTDTSQLTRHPLPESLRDGLYTAFPACAVTFGQRLTLPDAQMTVIRALDFTGEEELAYFDLCDALRDSLLDHLESSPTGANRRHQLYLLGYPENLEGDPLYEAHLGSYRISPPMWTYDPIDRTRHERVMMTLRLAARGWTPRPLGYRTAQQMRDDIAPYVTPAQLEALAPALQDLQPSPEQAESDHRREELMRQAEEEWRLLFQVDSNEEAEMDWEGGGLIHFVMPRADLAARDFRRVWVSLDFL